MPSWGRRCLEKGSEGELCPRAGAACSRCFGPPLPLGALQETQQGSTRPKGPHGLQGSPLGTGDTQGQCQSGKFPCHRPGMLLGLIPNSRAPSAQHTRGCPTALGPQAPWSTAHLDRAALLPLLLLMSFQHLKEKQESPEKLRGCQEFSPDN